MVTARRFAQSARDALALLPEGEPKATLDALVDYGRPRTVTLAVVARPEGGAELTVSDDGDGIPATLLPRVFEPHFSTRTSGSGSGPIRTGPSAT